MEAKSWQMVLYFVSYDFAWVSNMVHDCSALTDSLVISKKKERSFWLAQIWLFIGSLSCSSDPKGEAVQLHLPQVVHVLQRLAQVGSCFLVLQWVWPTLPNLSSASNLSDSLWTWADFPHPTEVMVLPISLVSGSRQTWMGKWMLCISPI